MKEPSNIYEKTLWKILNDGGWETLKNGWPDILAVKDDRVAVFEVKAKRSDVLKSDQLKCMGLLSRSGVECYRWDKDAGFIPYNEWMPDVKALNELVVRRVKKKEDHTCPICGKWKHTRKLFCWACIQSEDSSIRHQVHLREMAFEKQKETELREQANRTGLG